MTSDELTLPPGSKATFVYTRSEMGPPIPVTTIGENGEERTTFYHRFRTWDDDGKLIKDVWDGGYVEFVEEPDERAMLGEIKRRPEGSPLTRAEAYVWDNRIDWPAVLVLLAIGFGVGFGIVWGAIELLGRASF